MMEYTGVWVGNHGEENKLRSSNEQKVFQDPTCAVEVVRELEAQLTEAVVLLREFANTADQPEVWEMLDEFIATLNPPQPDEWLDDWM